MFSIETSIQAIWLIYDAIDLHRHAHSWNDQ